MTIENRPEKPGFWSIVLSTLAAAFGVQNKHNHEKDFKHGNIYVFIMAGIIFTLLFIVSIALIVKLVLSSAGL